MFKDVLKMCCDKTCLLLLFSNSRYCCNCCQFIKSSVWRLAAVGCLSMGSVLAAAYQHWHNAHRVHGWLDSCHPQLLAVLRRIVHSCRVVCIMRIVAWLKYAQAGMHPGSSTAVLLL
jgi:hypothetical protein